MARIIAIANVKGGVGKTTTTQNLAAALTERGRRVLAIDLDPQASLTLAVGGNLQQLDKSIGDALSMTAAPIYSLVLETNEHFGIVPATHSLYDVERELQNGRIRILALDNALEPVRVKYDYVLLDCPANAGILTGNALAAADEVIIPFVADYLTYHALEWFDQLTHEVRKKVNPSLRVSGLFIAMYDPLLAYSSDIVAEVKDFFRVDLPIFSAAVRQTMVVREAVRASQSVLRFAPASAAAEAYRLLAREVEEGIGEYKSEDAFAEIRRGTAALQAKDLTTAYTAFHKATTLDPEIPEAWIGRAQAAAQWDERVRNLAHAYFLKPDSPEVKASLASNLDRELTGRSTADIPTLMGVALMLRTCGLGEYARRVYECVTALDPDHEEAWLGQTQTSTSPHQKIEGLHRVLELNPQHAVAAQELQLANEQLNGQVIALVRDGESRARRGALVEARELFFQALELDSQNERALIGLARTSEDTKESLELVRRVLQINPGNAEARELHAWLWEPTHSELSLTPSRVLSILLALAVILLLTVIALYLSRVIH